MQTENLVTVEIIKVNKDVGGGLVRPMKTDAKQTFMGKFYMEKKINQLRLEPCCLL